MSMQVAEPPAHKVSQEAVSVTTEWIELPSHNTSRFFVRSTSYFLMEPDERERRWIEDVTNYTGLAVAWVAVMRELQEA